jgi:hypothetical protein
MRALDYQVDGELGHLAALEPLLPASLTDEHWIDLSDLRARIHSRGALSGAIAAVDARGLPRLVPHPLGALVGEDDLEFALEQVHYVDDAGVEVVVPRLEANSRVRLDGERRSATVGAHVPRATLTVGAHKLELNELRDDVTISAVGDPRWGELEATHTLTLGKLGQDFVASYPIADLQWTGRARRGSDGALRVEQVVLDNRAAGTHLTLSGTLLLPRTVSRQQRTQKSVPLIGFRSLELKASLEQRLDPLSGDPARFRGGGTLALSAEVASGDLHRFHVASRVKLRNASLELPQAHVRLAGLDGELPVVEDLRVERGHVTLIPAAEANAYSALRFSDQHPFLSDTGGLSAERISFGDLDVTHLAGNLRVMRNLFAADQLEAEVRRGRIAGQCLFDWRGRDSKLQLTLRMTGIEARHGGARERFDGNAVLAFSVAERELDGRVEILSIGRHHLYDLLDELDPVHKDAATNRVRTALALGYPDHVRVIFDRGFASFSVAFAGLARLVHVEDVRGIPTGPLIDRYLGSLLTQESPP